MSILGAVIIFFLSKHKIQLIIILVYLENRKVELNIFMNKWYFSNIYTSNCFIKFPHLLLLMLVISLYKWSRNWEEKIEYENEKNNNDSEILSV